MRKEPRLKIQSLSGSLFSPFHGTYAVRDKSEGSSFQQQQQQQEQEQEKKEQESPEQNSKNLSDAVAGFKDDSQAQANGLSATVEGEGPGLKVVLKDGSGGVVRQLTGEEFLRLRQSTVRGKILDQKL